MENLDSELEKRLGRIFPNPMKPRELRRILEDYNTDIRNKDGEHNKRAYFKSVILEKLYGINPTYIGYEEKRNDLYYIGIIFETKKELTQNNIIEGIKELKRYIKERKYVKRCVITDGVKFQVYNPETILNFNGRTAPHPDKYLELNFQTTLENDILEPFEKFYDLLYLPEGKIPLEINVIVPRILKLISEKIPELYKINHGIKFEAWKKYVSIVFGSEAESSLDLYFKHSLLYYVAVLMSAKILDIKGSREQILNGQSFYSKGILNFIEPGNFFDFIPYSNRILDDIEAEINLYDFENVTNDFFRVLYEELVTPKARHDLGEFYTPEWLAQILVDELVDKNNIILDPSCGSGTFIKLSLKKKKEIGSDSPENQVIGFDINPIAVVIAKANFLTEMKDVNTIPIFLADSLMPDWIPLIEDRYSKEQQLTLYKSIEIRFGEIVKGYPSVSFNYGNRNIIQMDNYLREMKSIVESGGKIPDSLKDNEDLINTLKKLIKEGKNHIWFYILRNIYNPYYYRKSVDVVIGNPPWLIYRDIKKPERQDVLTMIYDKYKMGSGPKNKPNQDMNSFFLVRSQEYLKDDRGRIGFVLPKAVMNASQYDGLRRTKWRLDYNISKIWDIESNINPFRKPSCIVLFTRDKKNPIEGYILDSNGKLAPGKTPILNKKAATFYINISENNSGISHLKVEFSSQSPYKKYFHRGASIFPKPYYFVDILEEQKYAYLVSTPPMYYQNKTKRSTKGIFNFHFEKIYILKDLVYSVISGSDLSQFNYTTHHAVLPITNGKFLFDQIPDGNGFKFKLGNFNSTQKNSDDSIKNSFIDSYLSKFNEIEKDWERYRGQKFTNDGTKKTSRSMSVWDNLNFQGKLLSQGVNNEWLTIYNLSGNDIRSAVVDGKSVSRLIIDDTAIYARFTNRDEAHYICGMLNSKTLIDKLKDSGILSERHITSKPLDLNIPKFNVNIPELYELQKRISDISQEFTALKISADYKTTEKELESKIKELDENVKTVMEYDRSRLDTMDIEGEPSSD